MNWKKNALGALAVTSLGLGCSSPPAVDAAGDGETRTYLLSAADVPAVDMSAGTAVGFNLDGMVTAGGGESCVDAAPDFTSPEGEAGVDNQFAAVLLPALSELADIDDVGALIAEQIADGSLLLMIQIDDDDDDRGGAGEPVDSVQVSLYLGELPTGATVMVDGSGRPTAGQDFDRGMSLGTTVTGTIEDGRLRLEADTLPLSFDIDGTIATLTLSEVRMEGNITADTITNGVIGAQITVASIVELGELIMPGVVTEELVRGFADPDLAPNADGSICDAISAGLTFASVGAANN